MCSNRTCIALLHVRKTQLETLKRTTLTSAAAELTDSDSYTELT